MFYGLPHRDVATYVSKDAGNSGIRRMNSTQSALLATRELCLDVPTTDMSHDVSRLEGAGLPVPAGMGRVRVDVLRVGSGTGKSPRVRVYPFLPVKNTIFHDVGATVYRMCFYFFLSSDVHRSRSL